jgi:hypothetical protein
MGHNHILRGSLRSHLRMTASKSGGKFQKTAKSISKMSRCAAVRHSNIFVNARNPFTAV